MTEATPTFDLLDPVIAKALAIATVAHGGQIDKGGKPYIHHQIYVANQMENNGEIVVALLHDVCEDSPTTLADLKKACFPEEVIAAVQAITKVPGEDYATYLKRVKANPTATKVKLADMRHNSDISRISTVTEKDNTRIDKYSPAS